MSKKRTMNAVATALKNFFSALAEPVLPYALYNDLIAAVGADDQKLHAIRRVLEAGQLGEVYNVGGWNEKANIDIVKTVCSLLDELRPRADGKPYAEQITYVTDRPGHDRRYAIDARKLERELGWKPAETFETGIRKTVQWYLDHPEWVAQVQSGSYRDWLVQQYGGQA